MMSPIVFVFVWLIWSGLGVVVVRLLSASGVTAVGDRNVLYVLSIDTAEMGGWFASGRLRLLFLLGLWVMTLIVLGMSMWFFVANVSVRQALFVVTYAGSPLAAICGTVMAIGYLLNLYCNAVGVGVFVPLNVFVGSSLLPAVAASYLVFPMRDWLRVQRPLLSSVIICYGVTAALFILATVSTISGWVE